MTPPTITKAVTTGCRLARFSLVGVLGIAVQLTLLSLLTTLEVNYLVATVLAVEAAILHNFIWHRFFTWPERQGSFPQTLAALLRFNLSTGLISLVGNLLLMRLLRGQLGVPLLPANLISISICALVNFTTSDRWVFPESKVNSVKLSIAHASAPECVAQRGDR